MCGGGGGGGGGVVTFLNFGVIERGSLGVLVKVMG